MNENNCGYDQDDADDDRDTENSLSNFFSLQVAMMPDRAMRLLEVKKLLERMPRANHAVLKFIFQHFVRWPC